MTSLEHKTACAWEHIRQCGSTFLRHHDGLRAGYRELKRLRKVTITSGVVRLAGAYLKAFHNGDDVR